MAGIRRQATFLCASALALLSAAAEPSFWRQGRFPAVTSPTETCVAVGEPFSFQVTYRCKRPWPVRMVGYAGKPLPETFAFDSETGVLTGRMDAAGERMVTFVIDDEAGRTVTWGDLKVRATPSRRQPKTLAGETFYQLQMPGFTESGDFAGVRRHLKRIAELGVAWVYLSPITVADRGEDQTYWSRRQRQHGNPRNPYRPSDYYNVDPDYGSNAAFRELVAEAHRLGLKVMTDVVFFHCGPNAVFLKEHPDWICRDQDGKPVRNEWMFPKLNIANRELRKYLKDSLVMWALDYGVDGFRADCGCSTPLDFWEDCAATIDAKKRDFVWLLEGKDPKYGERAYNVFYGFTCGHGGVNRAMDEVVPASVIREKWLEERLRGPAHAYFMRGTDTHDVANDDGERRQERRWGHRRAETALALSFALDGPMMLWQGQEIGWDRPYCIFTRTCPDWERPPVPERAEVVRRLATLKRTEPAFGSDGRIVWLEPEKPDDQVLFLRVAPDGKTYRCFFDLLAGTWNINVEGEGRQ